jgi:hypothetical protein
VNINTQFFLVQTLFFKILLLATEITRMFVAVISFGAGYFFEDSGLLEICNNLLARNPLTQAAQRICTMSTVASGDKEAAKKNFVKNKVEYDPEAIEFLKKFNDNLDHTFDYAAEDFAQELTDRFDAVTDRKHSKALPHSPSSASFKADLLDVGSVTGPEMESPLSPFKSEEYYDFEDLGLPFHPIVMVIGGAFVLAASIRDRRAYRRVSWATSKHPFVAKCTCHCLSLPQSVFLW